MRNGTKKSYVNVGLSDYRVGTFYHTCSGKWLLWVARKGGKKRLIGTWHKRGDAVKAVDKWVNEIDEIVLNVLP